MTELLHFLELELDAEPQFFDMTKSEKPEKTRLSDGTKFERFVEKGEIPELPIEEEEEADDLSDPRIGHLDEKGEIRVPVDENGNVVKGYEYLLKPVYIDIVDLGEDEFIPLKEESTGGKIDSIGRDSESNLNLPGRVDEESRRVSDNDFVSDPEDAKEGEYDDLPPEQQESLPKIPDLPKPDYTDSGESDEDLKPEDGDLDDGENDESNKPIGNNGEQF
uniref:Midasin n=1 Tax=Caenorhabditis tropicalis TaxID=1561998 RepID=A0A1I7TT93_9PELO